MAIYDLMKEALETYPKGRERKNKNRFIAFLLDKKYGSQLQTGAGISDIENIINDAYSYNRAWTEVTKYEPSLQGSDYREKLDLTKEKMIELGYSPYHKYDLNQNKKDEVVEKPKPYKD